MHPGATQLQDQPVHHSELLRGQAHRRCTRAPHSSKISLFTTQRYFEGRRIGDAPGRRAASRSACSPLRGTSRAGP
eukprot:363968-Chlamydomonas_euryale.AAC.3